MTLRETIAREFAARVFNDLDNTDDVAWANLLAGEEYASFCFADAILSLPELAKVREALEPFARQVEWIGGDRPGGYPDAACPDDTMSITYGDYRRAAEALSLLPKETHPHD